MKRGLISLIGSLVMAMLVNYDIALGKQFTKKKSQGTTTVTEAPIKQGEIKEVKLPPVKKEPPFKVGDIIGYSEPGLPERYVGKVVLYAKWGDGPGEVGLHTEKYIDRIGDERIYRGGVSSFNIDNKENIYISDSINNRVLVYNKVGKYLYSFNYNIRGDDICVDKDGCVYILDTINNILQKYTSKAKAERSYSISIDSDRVYIENKNIFVKTWKGDYLVGTTSKAFASSKQVKKPYKGMLGGNGTYRYEGTIPYDPKTKKHENRYIINVFTKNGKFQKQIILIPPLKLYTECMMDFLKADKNGNMYVLIEIPTVKAEVPEHVIISCGNTWDKRYLKRAIYKYNKKGELLSIIPLLKNYWTIYMNTYIRISDIGNIYQLFTWEDGIYIVKWENLQLVEE
jgi:hypothetical protein